MRGGEGQRGVDREQKTFKINPSRGTPIGNPIGKTKSNQFVG